MSGWIILGLLVLVGVWLITSYNTLVGLRQRVNQAFADIDVQLKQRHDLIPNLVETVKGFAEQEKEILTRIADSRAKLAGARTPQQTIEAANEQSSALARLLVIVENYPNLKSDAQFQRLMDELAGTENRIAVARGRYNERIQEYNTTRRRFPSNMTAKIFGFEEYPYFEVPPEARQVPKVDFGTPK